MNNSLEHTGKFLSNFSLTEGGDTPGLPGHLKTFQGSRAYRTMGCPSFGNQSVWRWDSYWGFLEPHTHTHGTGCLRHLKSRQEGRGRPPARAHQSQGERDAGNSAAERGSLRLPQSHRRRRLQKRAPLLFPEPRWLLPDATHVSRARETGREYRSVRWTLVPLCRATGVVSASLTASVTAPCGAKPRARCRYRAESHEESPIHRPDKGERIVCV